MVNVFEFQNYGEFLKALVKNREARGLTQSELAKAMGCQAAYLSQVLKDKAELTEDHGIRLCHFLEFSGTEIEYFLVILRLARAASPSLRTYLENIRIHLLELRGELEGRISSVKKKEVNEATIYYCSSWIPAVLHSATSCEAYQTSSSLSQRFHLEKSTVEFHLQLLEKFKFVRFEKGKWIFQGGSIHFPKASPIDQSFQINRRLHALNSISQRKPDHIHFATILPIDAITAKELREQLLSLIETVLRKSSRAPSEEIYSMNLDFYKS